MGHAHASTPTDRARWISHLLAHPGEYGVVSALSRTIGVSRQTLYTWAERGHAALVATFTPGPAERVVTSALERAILTCLVDGHAGYRGIRACLRASTGQTVSVGTIARVIAEAEQRAVRVLAQEKPATARVLALDEIYGNDRHGAYLSVVDAHSGAVWVTVGPVAVDGESWTLVLWDGQEQGLRWHGTVSDGGAAMAQATATVDPQGRHQRDVWHVLHECSKVQGRLERQVATLRDQAATVARQAARVAAGQRPRGRHPRTDVAAQTVLVLHAQQAADNLRYLSGVLHDLLEVVVLGRDGVLDSATREGEGRALLALLADLAATAPTAAQPELSRLHRHVEAALPALLTFARVLDPVQQEMAQRLGAPAVALVAWAWQRRTLLGLTSAEILDSLPPDWRPAAAVLLHAWDTAVRASSPVETWHSLVRPHLAVHRTLSPGLLALLAVYHNHTVVRRGVHRDTSPLQRSGLPDAPTDWLEALGYPPLALHPLRPALAVRSARPLARAA